MAESDQQVAAVDHRAEVEGLLRWLGDIRDKPDDPRTQPVLAAAQLHASLAIADQFERLNDREERRERRRPPQPTEFERRTGKPSHR